MNYRLPLSQKKVELYRCIKMATVHKYVCDCEVVCRDYADFVMNHTSQISNWADRVEVEEDMDQQKDIIEMMLRGEPYARKRRALRDKKRAQPGYKPPVQQTKRPDKPVCNKGTKCCNKKCTFIHPWRN